jgi:hypothetical protein
MRALWPWARAIRLNAETALKGSYNPMSQPR